MGCVMTCEQIAERLPDYFHKRLETSERSGVESHLQQCSGCAGQVEQWKQLGQLQEEKPSPALKKRFDAMLSAYEEGRWEHQQLAKDRKPHWSPFNWLRGAWPQVAMTTVLLVVGFVAGRYSSPPQSSPPDLQAL